MHVSEKNILTLTVAEHRELAQRLWQESNHQPMIVSPFDEHFVDAAREKFQRSASAALGYINDLMPAADCSIPTYYKKFIESVLEVAEHLQTDNGKLTATEQYDLGEQLYMSVNDFETVAGIKS